MPGALKNRQTILASPDAAPLATTLLPQEPADRHRLVQRAANGDRAAQQAVFQELFPLVHKHLSFVLGFGPTVDDAVQDSLLRIHRALPSFRGESSLATWALAIASRTAFKHGVRERKHHGEELDEATRASPYGHSEATSSTELRLLVKALGHVSLKKRLAFVLIAILDYSANEAGDVLGVSANTAASRFRHARQELLDYLERHGPH